MTTDPEQFIRPRYNSGFRLEAPPFHFGADDIDHTDVDPDAGEYVAGMPWVAIGTAAILLAIVAVGLIMIAYLVSAAQAHDAAAMVDPKRAAWFEGLKQPGNDLGCCNLTDCRQTQAKQRPDGRWQAILTDYKGERWVDVPPEKVLTKSKSIDGEAYICNTSGGPAGDQYDTGSGRTYKSPPWEAAVLCFVPPIPGF